MERTNNTLTDFCYIRWKWCMDFCKSNRLPPAQSWAWNKALNEYKRIQHEN